MTLNASSPPTYRREAGPTPRRALGAGRTDDRGDIHNAGQIVWECKSHKTIDLPGFLRELAREKANARVTTGAVVVKRRGSADPADWYAVLELSDFTELLTKPDTATQSQTPNRRNHHDQDHHFQ